MSCMCFECVQERGLDRNPEDYPLATNTDDRSNQARNRSMSMFCHDDSVHPFTLHDQPTKGATMIKVVKSDQLSDILEAKAERIKTNRLAGEDEVADAQLEMLGWMKAKIDSVGVSVDEKDLEEIEGV